jgi:plasmid stabilization system protein ParE
MVRKKKTVAKKYTVRLSTNALRNIDEITGYIAFINHQPLNAINIGDALFETFSRIGQHPFAFKECEELPTKNKIYRRAICFSWSIIYKIVGTEVIILGIIHTSRKPATIRILRKIQ